VWFATRRYEREVLRAQRPHLRRVLERDTPAGAPAVLVIAAVRRSGLAPAGGSSGGGGGGGGAGGAGAEVELTDGWYSMTGRLDAALSELLRRGRLSVGQKLLVQGCELGGGQEPAPPLSDAAESMWLALHVNGTRPVPWDTKLGARRKTMAVPLRALRPEGGGVVRGDATLYSEIFTLSTLNL